MSAPFFMCGRLCPQNLYWCCSRQEGHLGFHRGHKFHDLGTQPWVIWDDNGWYWEGGELAASERLESTGEVLEALAELYEELG